MQSCYVSVMIIYINETPTGLCSPFKNSNSMAEGPTQYTISKIAPYSDPSFLSDLILCACYKLLVGHILLLLVYYHIRGLVDTIIGHLYILLYFTVVVHYFLLIQDID